MQAPQYITDDKGNKLSVIIPISDYEQLLGELEELEDIRLYDEAKAQKDESLPFEDYLKQRETRKNA